MFVFSKIIAYGLQRIANNVTAHCYDSGVKGQCQRYLESVLRFLTQTHMVFLTEVFPILYNDCQYGISGKGKGQTYIEPGCLVSDTNSSYFSYLTKCLFKGFGLSV